MSDGSTFIEAKQSTKPAIGLWAPGWYVKKCSTCKLWFSGDKRAQHCADCAYAEVSVRYGIRQRRSDGSVLWLASSGHFIEDKNGSGIGIYLWEEASQAEYVLHMMHAAHAKNAAVSTYPSDEPRNIITVDLQQITRLEVIDEFGRKYVSGPQYDSGLVQLEFSVQDAGQTLKVFVKRR